jgi:hypothetical protein
MKSVPACKVVESHMKSSSHEAIVHWSADPSFNVGDTIRGVRSMELGH